MDNQPTAVLHANLNANFKNYLRPWCKYDSERFTLAVKWTELMPPILFRDYNSLPIISTLLKDLNGATLATLTGSFSWNTSLHGTGEILFPTISLPLALSAHEGKLCYLEMTDGPNIWQTEVMKIYDPAELSWMPGSEKCGWIKLSFSGVHKVGKIPSGVTQFIYLPSFIGEPEHDVFVGADKDGVETDQAYFGRVEKIMNTTVTIPEYVIDALSILPLLSNPLLGLVSITDQWNNQISAKRITFDSKWIKPGCLSEVKYSFHNELIVAKACGDAEDGLSACLAVDFTAKAVLTLGGAEFAGGYYTIGVVDIDFQVGELAVVYNSAIAFDAGPYTLREWDGAAWSILTVGNLFENCFSERESKWFYKFNGTDLWADRPVITSFAVGSGVRLLKGKSFKGSLITVRGLLVSNGCLYSTLGSITTQAAFYSTGITMQPDTYDLTACAIAGNCGQLACSLAVETTAPC